MFYTHIYHSRAISLYSLAVLDALCLKNKLDLWSFANAQVAFFYSYLWSWFITVSHFHFCYGSSLEIIRLVWLFVRQICDRCTTFETRLKCWSILVHLRTARKYLYWPWFHFWCQLRKSGSIDIGIPPELRKIKKSFSLNEFYTIGAVVMITLYFILPSRYWLWDWLYSSLSVDELIV